ncbi:MAG: hypothetical protein F9K18_02790 [Thermoanaerobaculia bacterium]|nr:MAG: hypothetical protein F9K18_02790 [Thermoanaerobaculia bacterium]
MPVPRAQRSPFRRLRQALLAAFALGLAAVAGLYVLGRPPAPVVVEAPSTPNEPLAVGSKGRRATGAPVVASEGFEYEQRVGQRSAFRLRGERFTTDQEGVVALQGVGLELSRENGEAYRVASRRATWDPRTREARLAGDVKLAGGRGFHLETDRLDLLEGGQSVVARTPVSFGLGEEFAGRAAGLRLDLESDVLHLRERVRIWGARESDPTPLGLEADDLVYRREERRLEAAGHALLSSGADRLWAERVDLELLADESAPRTAVASGGVRGRLDPSAEDGEEGGALTFEGTRVSAEFSPRPARPRSLELEGAEGAPARAVLRAADGVVRTLLAPRLSVTLVEGRPSAALAEGGVALREAPASEASNVLREASADRLEAVYDAAGTLSRVLLSGAVTLRQGDVEAIADRAESEVASGRALLTAARERVQVRSPRGELRAPRVEVERTGGLVRARGGVYAELPPGTSGLQLGPATGAGRPPIRVESHEADGSESRREWTFRGEVRASQGDSLLFADELRGTEADGIVVAEGSVRSLWEDRSGPSGPVATTVSSSRLTYRRDARRVEYEGDVQVRQEQRAMSCAKLTVELDDEQRARKMIASGVVRIVDQAAGRTVTGDEAAHDLAARTVLVEGAPVVLTETGGATVRGRRLLYDLAAGTARVLAEDEAP